MALPIEMVHGTGLTTVEENNEWRFGEQDGGVVSVTLATDLFNVTDETLRDKYLTGVSRPPRPSTFVPVFRSPRSRAALTRALTAV